jgi:hypothetical protein
VELVGDRAHQEPRGHPEELDQGKQPQDRPSARMFVRHESDNVVDLAPIVNDAN